jgi:soluble lytic murein transglycosylase
LVVMAVLALMAAALAGPARAAAEPLEGAGALSRALALAATRDWDGAASAARGAGADAAVVRDIIEWQRLRAGKGAFADYTAFLARRGDWPGLPLLRAKGEAAILDTADPGAVIGYFAGNPPQTAAGGLALIQALRARNQTSAATAEAVRIWQVMTLDAATEARLLQLYQRALAPHHTARLDNLLWQGEAAAARRMMPLVTPGWRLLAEARITLRTGANGADAAVAAVPQALADDPGLAWERVRWRLSKGLDDSAADLLKARSASATGLGRPAVWADARARIARALLRGADPRTAYLVAARHHLDPAADAADYAELEWLAGYIALRRLNDPKTALGHFRALRVAVSSPISLSRAAYWEGRAHEALGEAETARAAYAFGAEFQSAYYGLLAAEKAGLPFDPSLADQPRPLADWRKAGFARSSVLRAALLLHAAGAEDLAQRFFLHLGESQDGAGYAAMAALAQSLEAPDFAVLIAKQAAGRGVILPDAYFPDPGIVPGGLAVPRALALSIARRESEFDPAVISHAGARGLMQLMPGTAKMMAAKTGQPYDLARLTSDPAYNARLGSAYLAQLIEEFGDTPVLIAAGYNAGPGRPRAWISDLGDPRAAGIDAVDWVEQVPFGETRNYIMRVLEALVIYRARLDGARAAPRLSALLKGQ